MLSFRETEHVTASSTLSMGYHLPVYCVQKANSDSAMQVPSRTFYAAANESNTVLYLGRRSTIGGVQPWQPGIECRPRNSSLGVDSSSKWIPAVLRLRKWPGRGFLRDSLAHEPCLARVRACCAGLMQATVVTSKSSHGDAVRGVMGTARAGSPGVANGEGWRLQIDRCRATQYASRFFTSGCRLRRDYTRSCANCSTIDY